MAMALAISGCASMGPGTIGRDRFDYDHAINHSWKQMMLLNLVKMRYGDTPMFLDVASITNSYTLEAQVSLGSTWASGSSVAFDSTALGGSGHYADKPTITYNPLSGDRFTRSLMTPIAPGVVLSLIQSGYAADFIMQLLVSSANGVQNRFGAGARARGADPEFLTLCAALRRVQASGAVGMRIDKTKGAELVVLILNRKKMTSALQQDRQTVREILGIRQSLNEFHVVYGSAPANDTELALVTRSMLEILMDIAASIEVPDAMVAEGRVLKTAVFDTDPVDGFKPLVRIHSGRDKPDDAIVAVPYRNYWYWIDDRDFRSKLGFTALMMIFSLTDTGPAKGQPIITIPAG
ncbi:hypothetical protein QU481_09055 [Crenobacter sp. SG2303]|uniref:Uncharacterized protein n=1 Tax=Crenobacter oryzisoli TaxID=3056844 RepID=A0ABT7XMP1_9NEIS|nr:hypothetical protein [Crenobacter sp. SG2303]MDN0075044.1 hypothetical protein [Crenobacter sp. SG2303]